MSQDTPTRRRERRRGETAAEVEAYALEIMAVEGVAGLTISAIARRMGIRPPSVYNHVDSLTGVYDALFRRGQSENLATFEAAVAGAPSGLPAIEAGLDATARWAFANPVLAQLLFWRPVPGYRPTPAALAPAEAIVSTLRREIASAAELREVHRDATSDEGLALLAALHFGVISQHLANEPERDWESSRYASIHRRAVDLFVAAYPPGERRTRAGTRR